MQMLLGGTFLVMLAGIPGIFFRRDSSGGEQTACLLTLTGAITAFTAIIQSLQQGVTQSFTLPWSIPGGSLSLALDPLSACFVLPLLVVVSTGTVYGLRYWPQHANPDNGRKLRLFYGLISGAMILLLIARNSMLFLMAWEVMALSGFFLITTEDHKEEVRRAGFIYLVATHTGTLALFAMFALLGQASGSMDFPVAGTVTATTSTLIFLLGLFGFGMKAGLMPLHIWLPGAHAAAPSHASALLSGVMIKTGIYGLVRLTSLFAEIPPWWGWTILLLGALSGVLGVALALAQHDIKRLLAYHSVENIGIIALGLGIALLGRSYGLPALVVLGLSGCLLHVANHGLFKSLLFLSAGSVIHAVGSRDIDHYGGLLKRQPWTGAMFLGGAVAISGLPPLNGFVSEWLIYLGAFQPLKQPASALATAALTAPALALIGGLALACFVKVFGIAFLGEPRSTAASQAHEASPLMVAPMAVLLACCAAIGLLPFTLQSLLHDAAADWGNMPAVKIDAFASLTWISLCGWLLLALLVMTFLMMRRRSQNAPRDVGTWGCGYQFPAPRMHYTASSFADFLVNLFRFGLRSEKHGNRVEGLFPGKTKFSCHTPDVVLDRLLIPTFNFTGRLFRKLRAWFHNGSMALYLLYVFLTVVVLLAVLTR
mgnify:CR=1 FL=1